MVYLLIFLEGVATFISPCLLPMIPLYLAYFAGQKTGKAPRQLLGQLGLFMLGFTLVFVIINGLLYSLASFLIAQQSWIQRISGLWMIFIGLFMLFPDWLPLKLGRGGSWLNFQPGGNSFIFGLVFALTWTPCVGAYLSAALALTLTADHLWQANLMILLYCLGLSLPMILSAYLLEEIKQILRKYSQASQLIYKGSACLLIVMGLLWFFGYLSAWISL